LRISFAQHLFVSQLHQVLFVTGADVARDPRLVVGTLISATGIATAWYASIYPFLANSKLLDRATEAMELSDAGELLGDFALPAACCLTTIHVN